MFLGLPRAAVKALRLVATGHADQLLYELTNKFHGLDLEFVSLEALGLPPERAHFHSSSGGPTLARVFRTVGVPRGSRVVDLGSGKGGAVITLSPLGFDQVIGVELSAELNATARSNVAKAACRNVRLVQSDAALYCEYDAVTHVYMYNPFPCAVVSRVLSNLAESLARAPRRLVLVYRNPVCSDAVAASRLFAAPEALHPDQHTWHVYRHAAESQPPG